MKLLCNKLSGEHRDYSRDYYLTDWWRGKVRPCSIFAKNTGVLGDKNQFKRCWEMNYDLADPSILPLFLISFTNRPVCDYLLTDCNNYSFIRPYDWIYETTIYKSTIQSFVMIKNEDPHITTQLVSIIINNYLNK